MLHYFDAENLAAAETPKSIKDVSFAKVTRRSLLMGASASFAIGAFAGNADAFVRYPVGGSGMPNGLVSDPLIFISIDTTGTVTLIAHRAEMGTGARTSLPMVIADELGADWDRVKIIQAEGDEPKYGNQDTDGSRSMRHHVQTMRQMGAAVRHMLAQAAANEWGIDVADVTVGVHEVSGGSKTLGFGDLAEAAMKLDVPAFEDLAFKNASEFRYIGKSNVQIYDLKDITTGAAEYSGDIVLRGMKYAAVARPPVVGSRPVRYDASAAYAVPGVEKVLGLEISQIGAKFAPLGGIAVIATNTDAAIKGRNALEIEWGSSPHDGYNSDEFMAEMRETAKKPGTVFREEGDVDAAFANAARKFEREYTQAHMAHTPMEPPVAVANVEGGKAEIWAPVQSPYGARGDIAGALNMNIDNVRVNTPLLGGGFGRKSKCDFAIEAALLSQKIGSPVKVQWTREDDVQHSFYHTTSCERIEVALDSDNKVTGWRHNSVSPTILSTFVPGAEHQFAIETGMGHVDMPFEIPNVRCDNGKAASHTRIGWFRAVSNIPRAFAVQSFASELAHELGKSEREMLLELVGSDRKLDPKAQGFPKDFWNYGEDYDTYPIDTARLKNVLNMAADKAGAEQALPDGEGIGLAVHRSFVTYVAAAARVKVVDGTIRVPEIHLAVDCGFAVNPERIRSQMEGAAVMGMTVALHSGITFKNGAVEQTNFTDYEMVRSDNYPQNVIVHIVDNPFSVPASGVGEPGVPPIAPAIANAIFKATGKRMRDLPMGAYA